MSSITERLEARTLLTSFTVDTYLDTVDVDPGIDGARDAFGNTSLRAAIMEANATTGPHTIFLQGGHYSLTLEGSDEDGALFGDLDITADVTIFGTSSFSTLTTIIDAQHIDRVFDVHSGGKLVLEEIEIRGGDISGRGDGGAIRVDGMGTLDATNVLITENRASNGGAISNNGGTVTITNSVLADNRAEGGAGFSQGGAIESTGGMVTVEQSTIHDNRAMNAGGGIAVSGGMLDVNNSTIAQNTVGESLMGDGDGGGIYIASGGTAMLLASTVAMNSAGNEGGGIWHAGSLTLSRSIVSNNFVDVMPQDGFSSGGATPLSSDHNIVGNTSSFPISNAGNDQFDVDPNLLGLADNGGFTPTIALGGGSPAIDAGPMGAEFPIFDQRGFGFARSRDGDRMGGPVTDIGAFELQSPSDFFVEDNINGGIITTGPSGSFAGDFQVITDGNAMRDIDADGILNFGDFVVFDPGGANITKEFGVGAFGSIADAVAAARTSEANAETGGDALNEVVLGPGTYSGAVTLDVPNLLLRGFKEDPLLTTIDSGATFGIEVTATGVQLNSLSVTGALTAGVNVESTESIPMVPLSTFQASNIRVEGNNGDGVRIAGRSGFDDLEVQIRDSFFNGNDFSGLAISNVDTVELRNVTANGNGVSGGDGISIFNAFETALDTVTANGNNGSFSRGFHLSNVGPLLLRDPRTSANTGGNLFSNVSVLALEPVAGDVSNSVTVTGSEIQFDAGMGFGQQELSLMDVNTVQITGSGGNDTFNVDYSLAPHPTDRQLFLDGGPGNDVIISANSAHQRLTDARLTIAEIDEVAITSFEQASLTGGAGDDNLNATEFDGPVTLSGLAGNDTLRGSASDDVLVGGAGDDFLGGGPLHEQYVLGDTTFDADLNLTGADVTILDNTDTEFATILLDSDSFRFNDVTYAGNSLFVAPSGVISLGGPIFPQDNFDLTEAPETVGGIPIIAPLFDDWVTGLTAFPSPEFPTGIDPKVLYRFEDTTDPNDDINDRLIIEWENVYHRDQIDMGPTPTVITGASPVTFQLILELNTFDRDGDITFNYVDLDTGAPFSAIANGASATIGGKDGGDHAGGVKQVSFNMPNTLVGSNQAIVGRSGPSDGDDLLIGGDGDDILVTATGRDTLDGGSGVEVNGDRLVYDGLQIPLASDHQVNEFAIESRIIETPDRFYEFKAEYTNVEELELGFGPADQNITVTPDGLPALVSIDTRGPSASDTVTIKGTAGDDELTLSGTTVSNGTTSIDLAGVEDLILDLSSAGADSVSVDQNFSGSARQIQVVGDSADDQISLQSTTIPQVAGIFGGNAQLDENRNGGALLFEVELKNGVGDVTDQLAPTDVVISPDGKRVYVAAADSNSLVVYDRNPVTGELTFVESIVDDNDTITGLVGAAAVEVSADGRFVYVASEGEFTGSGTIASFVRHPGDEFLTFLTSTVVDNFGNPQTFNAPADLKLTPDGAVLMLASENDNAVSLLEVDPNGDLFFVGALVDGDSGIDGLAGASSIAVSPDGQNIYVTGFFDNSVAVFTAPDGGNDDFEFMLPSFVEHEKDGFSGVSGIEGASSVVVSPDGKHVYVTGEASDAVAVFSRDPGMGELTFLAAVVDSDKLNAAVSVSISPDGQLVYVAADGSNAVTVFNRASDTGLLTLRESLTSNMGGVDAEGTSVSGLTNAFSVTASSDGLNVYAIGNGDNALVRFNTPRRLNVLFDGDAELSLTTSDGDDTIHVGLDGLPAVVSINAGSELTMPGDSVIAMATIDDDLVTVDGDTLTFDGTTLTITNAEILNLFTAAGDDTVDVAASADGPQLFVDGGVHSSGDVLNIDAQGAQVTDIDNEVSFSGGFQPVGYVDIELVVITNSAPTINDDTFTIDETAFAVGMVTAFDADGDESLTYSIQSGNDDGVFAIDEFSGEITVVGSRLDFEQGTPIDNIVSFILTVEVTDSGNPPGMMGSELSDTATITIEVSDVDPIVASDQVIAVDENSMVLTSVGTVMLDAAGDQNSVEFSILPGTGSNFFTIDSLTGEITVAMNGLDHESDDPITLNIQVTDDGGMTTDTETVTVNILDVNEPPMIVAQSFNVDENSVAMTPVGTVLANDFETPSGLTFAITGGDTFGQFAIHPTSGAITVAKSGLDHESTSSFNLTVQVTDPDFLSASATVTVNIDDVNEAPILDPIGDQSATVGEELAFTASATDPDFPSTMLNFSLEEGAPTGTNITDDGNFTFTPTPDQDGTMFPVTIIVTDGALMASETITISVTSVELDFGDAPTVSQTLLVNDGPRHVIGGGLFLGNAVGAEVNGQPEAAALGDDANGPGRDVIVDDEDGITFLSALNVGATRQFRVKTSGPGVLDAWIDFNRNGTFESAEKLGGTSGLSVPVGFSTVSFSIPNSASIGQTFARFRLSSTGGLLPIGLATDGEVEDYRVAINAAPTGTSSSIEPALNTAVDGFFNAFPDELNDPDPDITGDELPLAVQAENGATAVRRNGAPPLNQTDPALRTVVRAINAAVARLEEDRGADENILVVATHPVDFLLTDTQGRSVGFTQAGGTVNEIGADATFSGDGVVELLTIRNADPGEYGLQLVGVGGVFRGGASLITPAGTQQVTFQGSLANSDEVQLALTYQEGLASFPTRTDLAAVDFSEIADFVAQIPTAESDAKVLAAGATEALASIAMDRLDGSLFNRDDDPGAAFERLLERISKARKKLLEAIETSLDEDELDRLKLMFGDDAEEEGNVEVLARALLESLSGPLISAPRQVKEISQTLQQLLDQLKEQREEQQKQQGNQPAPDSNGPKGATKSEAEDKRTSQKSPAGKRTTAANSSFVVGADDVAKSRRVKQTAGLQNSKADSDATREQVRRPKFISRTDASVAAAQENASAEISSDTRGDTSGE